MLTREGLPAAARLFDDRVADLLLRYAGEGPYEREPFVPDERAVAGLRAAAKAAGADLAAAGAAVPEPLRGSWRTAWRGWRRTWRRTRRGRRRSSAGSRGGCCGL